MLDISTSSVLFVTDGVSELSSPIATLHLNSMVANSLKQSPKDSQSEILNDPEKEVMFIMTRNADIIIRDGTTGTLISSLPMRPKNDSTVISMYIIGKYLQKRKTKSNISTLSFSFLKNVFMQKVVILSLKSTVKDNH